MDDVAVEQDCLLSRADGLEPGRVVFTRIFQKPNPVTGHQRRAGGSRERLVCELADGRWKLTPGDLDSFCHRTRCVFMRPHYATPSASPSTLRNESSSARQCFQAL